MVDQLTIMSVHPGLQGQAFGDPQHGGDIESILEKSAPHEHIAMTSSSRSTAVSPASSSNRLFAQEPTAFASARRSLRQTTRLVH